MSFALSAGVTGLQAHQKMPDVAGNNQVNVNTTAFKSSRTTFSGLLSETMKKGPPTSPVDCNCYKSRHCGRQQIQTNQADVEPLQSRQRSMAEQAANQASSS